MIRVGIIGASGYTAIEAIQLLLGHPKVQIVATTSRQADGSMIADMHPSLIRRLRLTVEDLTPVQLADRCDVAFSCLPHGASAHHVMQLLDAGCKVIDLSADYRLSTPALYQKWYGEVHPDPARLGSTPYGLPELFANELSTAKLIANPGCYPTSAILPLSPLIKEGLISPNDIIVDSKSGVSGAGRTPKIGNLYCEVNESISAYSVGNHRHQPEIVDVIRRYCGIEPQVVFTPHLVPMERGILSTIYAHPASGATPNQIRECLNTYYDSSSFVRVVSHLPATRFVARTNYVDITVRENGPRVILVSAIDNLIKGASGAAVQNMNLMFGLEPSLGLIP
ncbi:MAG: N-acetyl-gamma-glutamyl-phosphate reductase [Pirellula sp.]